MPEWPDQFDAIEDDPNLGDILDDIATRMPNEAMLNGMEESAHYLVEAIVEAIYSLAKDPKGGLADSYGDPGPELIDTGEEVVFGVFSDLVYAEIQDEGDFVFPKKKWLAFPHEDAKSFVGIRWPKDFPRGDFDFALSSHDPGGTAYLFGDKFKHPTFILKKSVEIPGLRYLDKALENFDGDVEKSLDKSVGLVFAGGGF